MKVIYNKVSNLIYTFVRDTAEVAFHDDHTFTVTDIDSVNNFMNLTQENADIEIFISSKDEYRRMLPSMFVIKDGEVMPGRRMKVDELREVRNQLLEDSDKLSLIIWSDRWASRTDGERTDWLNYRNELRNIFIKYDLNPSLDPYNHEWPDLPVNDPVESEITPPAEDPSSEESAPA